MSLRALCAWAAFAIVTLITMHGEIVDALPFPFAYGLAAGIWGLGWAWVVPLRSGDALWTIFFRSMLLAVQLGLMVVIWMYAWMMLAISQGEYF